MAIPSFLDFHKDLVDHLERFEPEIWQWFSSDKLTEQAFDDSRLELLKNAIRLDADIHPTLFETAAKVAEQLEIDKPISLYQGTGQQRNAALFYTPNELNILFEGETLEILSDIELQCLLGHEMAHYLHKTRENSRYFTADRMLEWICGEHGCHSAYVRSLWLSRLYQEIFADRVGLSVCNDRDTAISVLIKVGSGLKEFSVDRYLEQAKEAMEMNQRDGAKGYSHPETYIRAIALDEWSKDPEKSNANLRELVEGSTRLERLDLLGQLKLNDLTQELLGNFLQEEWASADDIQAHAKAYFPDFEPPLSPTEMLNLAQQSDDVKDYFASVLLDFAAADPDLEDEPLLSALRFADEHGLTTQIDKRVVKDLGVPKKKLSALRKASTEVKP